MRRLPTKRRLPALLRAWLWCGLLGSAACTQGPSHAERWQQWAARMPRQVPSLRATLHVEAGLLEDDEGQRFAIVRLSPAAQIRAVHVSDHQDATHAEGWSARFAAPNLVFNAGFSAPDGAHLGWLKTGGVWQTQKRHPHWQGLLLAEPTRPDVPAWQLLDLEALSEDDDLGALLEQYNTVVQTMVLCDARGQLRITPTARKAARSVLARDTSNHLLLFVSERAVTLAGMADALQRVAGDVTLAVNLDGGLESQLAWREEDGTVRALTSRHGSRQTIPERWSGHLLPRALPSVLVVER